MTSWKTNTRSRRIISNLAYSLRHSENANARQRGVALLLGAGMDSALTGRPQWTQFLLEIAGSGPDVPESLKKGLDIAAADWPTETAEALRIAMGSEEYAKSLWEVARPRDAQKSDQTADLLRSLVHLGIRIIVTTNYSEDIFQALTKKSHQDKELIVRVIPREMIPSWDLQVLFNPPEKEVHLIAIHGVLDGVTNNPQSPILGQHSYDQAIYSDPHYSNLLRRLFQDFFVLTIGTSWSDVPLKSAAAQVRHHAAVPMRTHAAILPHKSPDLDRWRERCLMASYCVRPLFYSVTNNDHAEVNGVIRSVSYLASSSPSDLSSDLYDDHCWTSLSLAASDLDAWGDYESNYQRDWFSKIWTNPRNQKSFRNWEWLYLILGECPISAISPEQWLTLARIERHLRHFLWIYLPEGDRKPARSKTWKRISDAWMNLPSSDRENLSRLNKLEEAVEYSGYDASLFSQKGVFDFGIGAFEVSKAHHRGIWEQAFALLNKDSSLRRKVDLAMRLWRGREDKTRPKNLRYLRYEAADCGWEALEAKLALDMCESELEAEISAMKVIPRIIPRKLGNMEKTRILQLAKDARDVAQIAGCGRRETGAIVTGSFVADCDRAASDLVAVFEKNYSPGGGMGAVGDWGVYIGLIASVLDRRHSASQQMPGHEEVGLIEEWLQKQCGVIKFDESQQALGSIAAYWKKYHRPAAEIAEQIIKKRLPHPKPLAKGAATS